MKIGLQELIILGIPLLLGALIYLLKKEEPGGSPASVSTDREGRKICPRCGGPMVIQTMAESRNAGCLTVLCYFILAITLVGILILIPLLLRKKTHTVTYATCQQCGNTIKLAKIN